MSLDLLFIVDTPTTLDAGAADGDLPTSRIQVGKTGDFNDPGRYGKFKITRQQLASWIRNFDAINKASGGLALDIDHGPEYRHDTEAAGWMRSLDQLGKDGSTPTPDQLWATVAWTTLGQTLVGEQRYRFISPTYNSTFVDEHGKQWGHTLVGAALTNRPFLTMASVSLSKADVLGELTRPAVEQTPPPVDSRATMPDLKILTALGLADGATEDEALAKITELKSVPVPPKALSLDAQAAAEGKIILTAAAHAEMAANATAGKAAMDELHSQKFTLAWAAAETEGRATPAMKDTFTPLYEAAPDAALAAVAALPKIVNVAPTGHGGGGDGAVELDAARATDVRDAEPVDEDRLALHNRTLTIAAEKNMSYGDALMVASREG